MDSLKSPPTRSAASVEELRFAARHLAVACRAMAGAAEGSQAARARYARAESRLRCLADSAPAELLPTLGTCPAVRTRDGGSIPLVDLLDVTALRIVPGTRGVLPEMVDGACQMLAGLRWYLPEDDLDFGASAVASPRDR